ncbi:MAG: hypothetical protein CMM50_07530, partial [Rhodospirillaceae bacterium]|nr:hypothetical protein [Rhodospirillaceae bacterium]
MERRSFLKGAAAGTAVAG